MWNDRDAPIAYLITFRCYGTWLHGDERGSINKFNNRYQTPYITADKNWEDYNKSKLKGEAVLLDAKARSIVERTIREVCEFKNWILHAVNIRTNHVHAVVSIGDGSPATALNAFKSYSTKNLRLDGFWKRTSSPWSDKGSRRYLWNEKSLEKAIEYVVGGQGGDLPDFD